MIYRSLNSSFIIQSITPIANVIQNSYQDSLRFNGTYYYVIVAVNGLIASDVSNFESVVVGIKSECNCIGISGYSDLILISSCLGVCVIISIKNVKRTSYTQLN